MSGPVNARPRLELPQVTLVAVTSVNVAATVIALERSMAQVAFGAVKLIADHAPEALRPGIEWVRIAPLASASAYSGFVLERLADHVATSHALLAQWDGHVIHADRWRPEFLDHDYIGAAWPQFDDGFDVGNGGFSLRSRALMEACRARASGPRIPKTLPSGARTAHGSRRKACALPRPRWPMPSRQSGAEIRLRASVFTASGTCRACWGGTRSGKSIPLSTNAPPRGMIFAAFCGKWRAVGVAWAAP